MKNNEIENIEDLLINKSFSELSDSEREFVLSQVESEQEYGELRTTLISIKQISKEEQQVVVPSRVKDDLMQLMEQKKKPIAWFNLNALGAFLFPADTSLIKKPGLQFATLGVLLLLVINIGLDFTNATNDQLAINTTVDNKEPIEEKKESSEENSVTNSNEINLLEQESDLAVIPDSPEEEESIEAPQPAVLLNIQTGDEIVLDVVEEEIAAVQKPLRFNRDKDEGFSLAKNRSQDGFKLIESEKTSAGSVDSTIVINGLTSTGYFNATTLSNAYVVDTNVMDFEGVTLNSVAIASEKKSEKVKTVLNSQSLESSEEIIGLLHIAL